MPDQGFERVFSDVFDFRVLPCFFEFSLNPPGVPPMPDSVFRSMPGPAVSLTVSPHAGFGVLPMPDSVTRLGTV